MLVGFNFVFNAEEEVDVVLPVQQAVLFIGVDFETGELWGNFPQTYSLVGIINCAGVLTRLWSEWR